MNGVLFIMIKSHERTSRFGEWMAKNYFSVVEFEVCEDLNGGV